MGDFGERANWLARNVLPHEALVRSRVGPYCSHDISIDDVIQEMYARILSVPSLRDIRHPRQYAVLTAKSIVIDHLRRSRIVPIKACGNLELFGAVSLEPNSEERLEFKEEIKRVVSVLAQLPPDCRETLILRRVEGLSQKEVARRLNVSEKMVEKHMARGARALAALLGRGGKSSSCSSNASVEDRLAEGDVEFRN